MLARRDTTSPLWHRLELALLVVGVAIALWPVWTNAFFVTNDGPCHLYNARILRDMLLGHDTAYYAEWYFLNPHLDPNWLTHGLLLAFQLVLAPEYAEKLLVTCYIVGFALALRHVARTWFADNSAFVFLALPFVFHKVFLMGFFNFSLSIVLMLVVVGYWGRALHRTGWKPWVGLGLLLALLLLAHPLCYGMALAWMGFHWLGSLVYRWREASRADSLRRHGWLALGAGLAALPSLLLFLGFIARKGTETVPSTTKLHTLWHNFIELSALVMYQPAERTFTIILSVAIGALVLTALVRRGWIGLRPQDGIVLLFVILIYAYFTQPASVGGVGIIPERLQPIPYLLIWVWLCCVEWPLWLRRTAMVVGFAITVTLFGMRVPDFRRSSEAVEEFVGAAVHMRPYTTVLMLDYAPEGRLPHDGPALSKEAYIYMHIAEYIGAISPHIVLNNYEANTTWFPLRWRADRDPYVHLSDGPGLEGWTPTVDFGKFRRETGRDVDYVLTWCLTAELRQHGSVQMMLARLEADYEEAWVSEGERVRLWARKVQP